jgi:xanthine dehydrogenase accessory factor
MFDHQAYYRALEELLKQQQPLWQAIVISSDGSTPAKPGMHLAIPLEGKPSGNLGGGNLEFFVINLLREKQPVKPDIWKFDLDEQGMPLSIEEGEIKTGMICGGKAEVFIEPLFLTHKLYIIGGGHCGRALAHLASLSGYQVTVVDNRKELLLREDFPDNCLLVYNDYSDLEKSIKFAANTSIVIMTHGHIHDKQVLEFCLRKPFFYLGMIGSEKKVAETFKNLKEQGFSEEELSKVHAPVGLSIGSQTPYEIAVSITAELIKERNRIPVTS